ncbi:hypothetical protein ACFV2Z_40155 [Streptomyces sp. NPDC059688]|uniref:hypothetical protein n=1 Tax=Streptomyces sp. NPDC059688 TaxID=3346906 RepID=UPI0036CB3927
MDTNAEPEQNRHTTNPAGPPIRQLFRGVIADRMPGPRPPQAAMLFDAVADLVKSLCETCTGWTNLSWIGEAPGCFPSAIAESCHALRWTGATDDT